MGIDYKTMENKEINKKIGQIRRRVTKSGLFILS